MGEGSATALSKISIKSDCRRIEAVPSASQQVDAMDGGKFTKSCGVRGGYFVTWRSGADVLPQEIARTLAEETPEKEEGDHPQRLCGAQANIHGDC